MKQLFGWLKGKISRDGRNKSTHSSCETAQLETNEQEFSNLLTIGTLGDQYLNKSNYHLGKPPPFSSPPLPQDGHLHHEDSYQSLSPEEVEKLQQDSIDLLDSDDLPDSNKLKLVRKGIDHCMDADKKATLQKKLSSFLLKKVLACRRSFSPVPDFRTPSESLEPRMGKVLRVILNKKIYPHQSSCGQPISPRRLIRDRPMVKLQSEDDDNTSKWDKTDSECSNEKRKLEAE